MGLDDRQFWQDKRLVERIVAATLLMKAEQLRLLLRKGGFRPDQPRVPAGNPDGGQWTDEFGQIILANYDPSEFPDVPEDPPPTRHERNVWSVRVARYLFLTGVAVELSQFPDWVERYARDRIIAYLDEPKFLDELQRAADEPKPGYDNHHIAEQTPARLDGFPQERIQGWRNKVRIPTYRHWEINSWYERPNGRFGGLTPRQYLRGKSWEERYRVGLDALRLHGVLK